MTADASLRAQVEERLRAALRRAPVAPTIPRRVTTGPAPLSPAQWRLWLLEQLEPGGAAYNLPFALRLRGPLQPLALAQALQALVRRHDVLRASFPTVEGQPWLHVHPPGQPTLEELDLCGLGAEARETELGRRAQAEACRPFDLERGPLFRATLLRLAVDDAALLLGFHHAVSDGWSQEIVLRELSQGYAAALAGREARLPELPLSYGDYAAWQRARLEAGAYAQDVVFWRERLDGLPALELPSTGARGAQRGRRGAHRAWRLPLELQTGLQALARAEGLTLFAVLLAGFVALLRRYSGQRDFAVGTAVAGRSHAELEGLVGLFVNTLPLRFRLPGEPTFRELLAHARDVTLEAFEHQEVPLEQLVAELAPERDARRNPFFQVLFTLRTTPPPVLELPGVTVEPVPIDTQAAKFDCALQFEARPDGLAGLLEYDADLFTVATVERLAGHLETLLRAALQRPDARLGALPLLSAPERRQTLGEWASNPRPYPRQATLRALFEAQARRSPAAPAIVTPQAVWTYDVLRRRASRLAQHLIARGVGRGTRVGLRLERSAEQALAQLAVIQVGAAYVPLDGAAPAERLALVARDAGLRLIVTRGDWVGSLAELGLPLVVLDTLALDDRDPGPPPEVAGPHDVAYVMYTSGSTGVPKGVVVPQRAITRLVIGSDFCQLGPDDVVAQVSNPAFDAATFEIWGALLNGARLAVLERDEILQPLALAQALRQHGATAMFLTAALFHQAAREAPEAFAGLRTLIVGGDQIDPALAADVWRAGAPGRLLNGYGPTENTTFSTWHAFEAGELAAGSTPIGRPLANSSAYVLDRALEPLPCGVPGELYVGGDGLAHGYLGRPDLTAERFVPDPHGAEPGARLYRTGDQVRQRVDGVLEFLGRLDQQVKVRGFRVELGEIEAALGALPGVRAALVLAPQDDHGTRRLLAFVQPAGLPLDELRAGLRRCLPAYMLPGEWLTLDAFPLNPNGKVDRAALLALSGEQPASAEREVGAPRDALEEALAGIWSDELGRESLGLHDDFFESGGHSLMATRVIARVRQACGVDVPLRCLFDAPTVARFAAQVREAAGRPLVPELPQIEPRPAQRHEPFPLTDVQQAYWIGRSADFDLGQVGTHLYFEVDCAELDLPAFESAWRALIARHDMLRAVFSADAEQRVLPEPPTWALEVLDLVGCPAGEADAALEGLRARLETQVFDPARFPLFEIVAARLPDGGVRLHFSFDALLADAWSLHVLFADLDALRHGRPLEPLVLTFRDYVLGEQELRRGALHARALEYWRARLDSLPAGPALPLRRNPRELHRPSFTRRSALLPAEDWTRLKRRARRAGLTPSATLLQAFSEVLATWSKEPRFTLNLTLFNRLPLHAQVERVVGDFTSLNLLEVDAWGTGAFAERARRLQRRLWDDLDQRAVSGVRVLRELARRRGVASLHMPVVFTSTLSLGREGEPAGAGLQGLGELRAGRTQTPQVWLDHQVGERAGALRFNWDAVEELFPEGLLDDMFGAYRARLEGLARDDASWSDESACPLPAWQARERALANATAAPLAEATLFDLFAERARQAGECCALVSARRVLSYAELAREARAVAGQLLSAGLLPGDHVAVVMDKGWEQVAAVLGVLHAGGVYVPIDPAHPAERLAWIFEHGRVVQALTQPWLCARLAWPAGTRPLVVEPCSGAPAAAPVARAADDLAYVIYTSGSTGQPKGVAITHRGAVNTLIDLNARFDVGPGDRLLALSALGFDLSVYDIFGALQAGAGVIVPEASDGADPAAWLALAQRHGATIWNSVPALMQLAVETLEARGAAGCAPLRLALLSGDWIPVRLPERVRAVFPGCQVVSLGGATEASIWSILHEIGDVPAEWSSIPYGRPLRNQTFHVLDERLEPRPVWVAGELYIGGVGLAAGYLGDEQRTRQSFLTHPRSGERLYRTGDLGRYLPGGEIEFLGREDFQVKIQGYRIELGEIEAALLRHPDLAAAVVCAPGSREARRLVAYVVPRDAQAPPREAELRQSLAAKLPSYMLPSAFVTLDALPLTANGKLDRARLPAPGALPEPTLPARASALEARLASLAAAVLGQTDIEPQADLLALGATSVDLIRLLNQVERECGVRPELRALYDDPTPAALARAVAALRATTHAAPAGAVLPDDVLRDPEQREAFKRTRPGRRRLDLARPRLALPGALPDDAARQRLRARRSQRTFGAGALRAAQLGGLLRGLAAVEEDGQPKHLYPSAGGLYAVQVHLHVKPGAFADLACGAYCFEPDEARLAVLAEGVPLDARLHEPSINRPLYERAAFSVFLVAQLRVLRRLYGGAAERFAALEAGHLGQVLMEAAPAVGLGLCPIGDLDASALRELLDLEDGHELVYSFVGGGLPAPDDLEHETWEL